MTFVVSSDRFIHYVLGVVTFCSFLRQNMAPLSTPSRRDFFFVVCYSCYFILFGNVLCFVSVVGSLDDFLFMPVSL